MPFFSRHTDAPTWLTRALALLAASALIILVLGQYTDLDLWLADLYFDPASQRFPWDKTWFATAFMHGYVKNVLMWIGFLLMAGALLDLIRPFARLAPAPRAALRISALAAFFEPLLISTLKRGSALHCPWGVDRYGGHNPFLRLLDVVPADWAAGHCFPAGHASSAMWLSALAAFWLPHAPARARAGFWKLVAAPAVICFACTAIFPTPRSPVWICQPTCCCKRGASWQHTRRGSSWSNGATTSR